MPGHPSTAQVRSGHCRASASIARYPATPVPYRPPPTTVSSLVMTSIAAERWRGSIPMITWLISSPSYSIMPFLPSQEGTANFEPGKPLLSLSPLTAAPGPRRPNESHTTSAGSRNESDGPGTWTEPGRAPVLGQVNK